MRVVYILTSGEYSAYRIEGVFSKRIDAEKTMERLNTPYRDQSRTVEEWPLDDIAPRKGLQPYHVYIRRDGEARATGLESIVGENESYLYGEYGLSVWARSEKSAIKIAMERRLRYIADHKL